ncbi:hypothetical protein J6590_052866 [Homalodisca vitripennis]|nr:hypothetical protein J6590_052866 [Homalodisca vitripennis]
MDEVLSSSQSALQEITALSSSPMVNILTEVNSPTQLMPQERSVEHQPSTLTAINKNLAKVLSPDSNGKDKCHLHLKKSFLAGCKNTFHYRCIPKKHLDAFGLDESDDDEDELNFLCHLCADDIDSDNDPYWS